MGAARSESGLFIPDVPIASHEETRRLLGLAQGGDLDARNRLVEGNLRLVASLVHRFSGRGADSEDLFQAGCLGLMRAIDGFDLTYDVRFSTYAVPLILAEIHRYLRENRSVRITRHGLDLARRASEAREKLQAALGRSPTPQEIGAEIGAAKEEVVAALDATAGAQSLDEPAIEGDEGAATRLDFLRSELGGAPERLVDGLALAAALRSLSDTERKVLVWRFVHERRQVEVAKELGVSQAHISRLERRILTRIRQILDQ